MLQGVVFINMSQQDGIIKVVKKYIIINSTKLCAVRTNSVKCGYFVYHHVIDNFGSSNCDFVRTTRKKVYLAFLTHLEYLNYITFFNLLVFF